MFGSVRQSLHHSHYLCRGSGVPPLPLLLLLLLLGGGGEAQGEVAEVARRVGGHKTEDLVCELLCGQLPLGQLDTALHGVCGCTESEMNKRLSILVQMYCILHVMWVVYIYLYMCIVKFKIFSFISASIY